MLKLLRLWKKGILNSMKMLRMRLLLRVRRLRRDRKQDVLCLRKDFFIIEGRLLKI